MYILSFCVRYLSQSLVDQIVNHASIGECDGQEEVVEVSGQRAPLVPGQYLRQHGVPHVVTHYVGPPAGGRAD